MGLVSTTCNREGTELQELIYSLAVEYLDVASFQSSLKRLKVRIPLEL